VLGACHRSPFHAFLASAAGTASLQAEVLADCDVPEDPYWKEYLELWSASGNDIPEPLPLKQSSWDRPGTEKDRTSIESGLTTTLQRASFNAATSRHSGDWLQALPITSCGLKLDDEAIRVAVGIRLALYLCVPHQCRCGSQVDSFGRHSLVCKRAPGRTVRHHHLNDVIARSLDSAGVPVFKEPSGLSRSDGKRPDGLTMIPWHAGRSLTWNVTVSCTTADSYLEASSREADAAAELAASHKVAKYVGLSSQGDFVAIAVESHGPINRDALQFLSELGRRLVETTADVRASSFLFQRHTCVHYADHYS